MQEPNFQKHPDGLLPCVVQDVDSKEVLMLGYMNAESFQQSIDTKKVTFFSRSKQRLWTKGEESGHTLWLKDIKVDCDQDTVLVFAQASGPVCHKQTRTCFTQDHDAQDPYGFLYQLEGIQAQRIQSQDQESYTRALWEEGLDRIVQKVGEEAIELVIASKNKDLEEVKNEAADLLYHFLLLLKTQNLSLQDIETVLINRSKTSRSS